ncbi:DUF2970 domain-containing protein [Ferrimonas lipolytica]|uniref:DUF2970 domain-containing protein n=1 Tax=Ferrimonas lipolytica TaxID=2724191 RepID=A0A6H1UJM2_9GAMM|nr:DUF2970 domain-containing protein [Ferrimonas lipolytica]QIZ78513.1 DUF2970 domain-containing protein [Ferrimonas lipolytica]
MQTLLSVLAALFGVQTEANRQRDFKRVSPLPFIATGIIAIIIFVISLIALVQWVLS